MAKKTLKLPAGQQTLDDIHQPLRIIPADRKTPPIITNNLVVYAADVELDGLMFSAPADVALMLRGQRNEVQRCTFQGNHDAIVAEKQSCIHHNTVISFSGDGIRFCGNATRVAYNSIGLLRLSDDERAHHDAIQMYAGDPGTPMRAADRYQAKHSLDDAVITQNHIFDVPGSPLQGITLFDGLSRYIYVGNNVINLFSNHPLTLRGSIRPSLFNNQLNLGKTQLLPARRLLADGGWEDVDVSALV